jgi:hypothetical protein
VTLDGGPRRRSESIPQRQRRRRPRMDVDEIIAKLEAGSAGEREAAYCAVEQSVRAAWAADGSSGREQAGALAVAVTRPLISSVLCAQASRVGEKEVQRAGLLLYEMARLEPVSVIGEANRKDDEGVILIHRTWVAPASVLAGILAMEPDQWTIEHAITCSTNMASQVPMWAAGCSAGIAAADMPEAEWFDESFNAPGFLAPPTPRNRHLGLALLCLDLLRGTRPSTQAEGITVGAAACVCWLVMNKPELGLPMWEAGGLEVTNAVLRRFNPLERISRRHLVPSACLAALKDIAQVACDAGIDVVGPLIDAGAMDMVIQHISAYQMLGSSAEASVTAIEWGTLFFLEVLLESPGSTRPLIEKLRGAGAGMFRHMLDVSVAASLLVRAVATCAAYVADTLAHTHTHTHTAQAG